ncbi:hypothetical protein BHECKSOX_208 [Bathymodiolus heckerae thiotrophic gill symbiont]|uniref:class I SAM-dependent methyltransferase n=1 Tax=Bathymodiolus heckerae thiotrophic gill symbiont TaxID=1052212 RepID=UPI0010B4C39E|nr:class I SAM-dependent methyltransferase [Bathymodiolus heckerae thiotrophic gill symbiont]SHN93436.1 hypothetical protein BHECKSOX_208 [Bathymodiolus heckerae thiotrophic gill symbiont]
MDAKNKQEKPGIRNKNYWDSIYTNGNSSELLSLDEYKKDYKQYCDKLIMDKIIEFYGEGSVLEIGAGNSDWIIRVFNELKPPHCAGLDYSEEGCRLLEEKSKANGVNINVVHADMFSPPVGLIEKFNFVMSFGVVEHFKDLAEVLGIVSQFSKPGGLIFSIIPNMAGVYGVLTRLWNKEIYDIHVPHDLPSFIDGHHVAGLDVLWADYLGSSNFSVLSSCFKEQKGFNFFIYKQLTRISKVLWFFESHIKELPVSKAFSPYILIVSRVPE